MTDTKPTILVVDDTKENVTILLSLLHDYDVVVALNGAKALAMVEKNDIDLILLDIMMPDMDGFEVCTILQSRPDTSEIPIIFITAKTDEESIEKAYDIGGSDYVTKPFKPKELLARVKRELQLQAMQKELKLLASTDPMTKLYNRRYFMQTSMNILNLAKRDQKETSLVMLDIDKFKLVNDTYGHQVGDDVIVTLANRLTEQCRQSDIICRYGGEEFVILLPETSLDEATNVAEKIRESIEQCMVTLEDSKGLQFTVSLGVSVVNPDKKSALESVLKRADDALYEAKESGRNRVVSKGA